MAIKMSAKEIDEAKGFMAALLFYAEELNYAEYSQIVGYPSNRTRYCTDHRQNSKKIVNEIYNRQFTFIRDNLDSALGDLSQLMFQALSRSKTHSKGRITRNVSILAKYIAWFCLDNDIIWDDSAQTEFEMAAILGTALGDALFKAGCFLVTKPSIPSTAKSSSSSGTPRTPGQPPANGYKSTGAHSQDIPNLVGQPSQKVTLSGKMIYITADKIGKNTPRAFVTPLKTTGNGNIIKVSKAQAEQVKFGSGNGYTDCQLWFDNTTDADICLQGIQQAGTASGYQNLRCVAVANADPNGYFKVTTDFGPAYIKAAVLNEELVADNDTIDTKVVEECKVTESTTTVSKKKKITDAYDIQDIDIYDEAFHASLS